MFPFGIASTVLQIISMWNICRMQNSGVGHSSPLAHQRANFLMNMMLFAGCRAFAFICKMVLIGSEDGEGRRYNSILPVCLVGMEDELWLRGTTCGVVSHSNVWQQNILRVWRKKQCREWIFLFDRNYTSFWELLLNAHSPKWKSTQRAYTTPYWISNLLGEHRLTQNLKAFARSRASATAATVWFATIQPEVSSSPPSFRCPSLSLCSQQPSPKWKQSIIPQTCRWWCWEGTRSHH